MRGLLRTAVVALLVLGAGELAARIYLGSDDDWKFWRIPIGERIDLLEAREEPPQVLFIGDSTAATNLVPDAFTEASGLTTYNLGTRGNLLGSFSKTMLDHVVPELENQPRAFVVSFSATNFRESPFFDTVAKQVNNSLFARSARGEFIWGDWFALARLRHRIRTRLPHQTVDPKLDAQSGWQPWEVTHAQKRPNARKKISKAPWVRPRPKKSETPKEREERLARANYKLDIVKRLGAAAGERPVVLVLPPAGRQTTPRVVDALVKRAPKNVVVWDYTAANFDRGEGAHLKGESAKAFTTLLGERFKAEVQVP